MKKKIKQLIKYICKYTNLSKDNAINYLIALFDDTLIFSLPEKKQLIIIDNLLLFFDTLIIRNETGYKSNKNFNSDDIINHLNNKAHSLSNNIKNMKFY